MDQSEETGRFYVAHPIKQGAISPDETYVGLCGASNSCTYAAEGDNLQTVVDAVEGHRKRAGHQTKREYEQERADIIARAANLVNRGYDDALKAFDQLVDGDALARLVNRADRRAARR